MKRFGSFENEWLVAFAEGLDEKEMKEHVLEEGNYIWHVFSFELLPTDAFLVGDAARAAFDARDKTGARYFEPWPNLPTVCAPFTSPTSAELDSRLECYVMAADKSWTYIKTHEGDPLGPYFYRRNDDR